MAPLTGVQIRFPPAVCQSLLAAMTGHAAGDQAATGRLRGVADGHPDAGVCDPLHRFLTFSPQDAAYVTGELARR